MPQPKNDDEGQILGLWFISQWEDEEVFEEAISVKQQSAKK